MDDKGRLHFFQENGKEFVGDTFEETGVKTVKTPSDLLKELIPTPAQLKHERDKINELMDLQYDDGDSRQVRRAKERTLRKISAE